MSSDRGTRFVVRAVTRDDADALVELARHLDSVNLPHDRAAIERLVERSEAAFSGSERNFRRREYVFALVDHDGGEIVGTSQILAQLGRRDAPYVYFDVHDEERYSETLDRHFRHRVLQIAYSFDGPTELGGLVLSPRYRGHPARLGTLISYVRFLWIAAHRGVFRDDLLAELLPPLEPDGTSYLWEAIGRRFTGLDYREADRLSKVNKEFIRGLFPAGDLYATLLGEEARAVIGQVGEGTRGVARMLERQRFRYVDRVDPFDGGPHFMAPTDEVPLVAGARRLPLGEIALAPEEGREMLLGLEIEGAPWWRAIQARGAVDGPVLRIGPGARDLLGITADSTPSLWSAPLP